MSDSPGSLPGHRLTVDEYFADYSRRYERAHDITSWKLERRQAFIEPGDDSWEEFNAGNWSRALELLDERRPRLLREAREDLERGIELYRVRVVSEPIGPYLLWELNALAVRHECGEKIRVVNAELVREFERDGELPEILTLGPEVAYQVLYGEDGALSGAIVAIDRPVVKEWTSLIEQLYELGEDMDGFFARKVAGRRPSDAA